MLVFLPCRLLMAISGANPGDIAEPAVKSYCWRQGSFVGGKCSPVHQYRPGSMRILYLLTTIKGTFEIDLDEKRLTMKMNGNTSVKWFFDLNTAPYAKLPFQQIKNKQLNCRFEGMNYAVKAISGSFSIPENGAVLRVKPEGNMMSFDLSDILKKP